MGLVVFILDMIVVIFVLINGISVSDIVSSFFDLLFNIVILVLEFGSVIEKLLEIINGILFGFGVDLSVSV